ncbi:Small GTPase superfamily, Rho type [Ascosphaera apis ARSEF 7405]|uniref:Small GTPase superfamily, Rho type n=1 Tax=Ascosphaera apis ARSEF 7405 TaxID=392613 RepID=A0A168BRP1_9EURO|nr:Small GTPase superfamily, Rho type [Ascosphaera apis ARSEF 7405]
MFSQEGSSLQYKNYVHDIYFDNIHMELSLWDTAGQEEFDRLRALSYDNTEAIMLCYSVDSPESLENIEYKWITEIADHCPAAKIVLVALKCDLREEIDEKDDSNTSTEATPMMSPEASTNPTTATTTTSSGFDASRIVSYAQGLEMAKKIGALRYLECSAKRNRGVKEAFTEAARVALTVGSQDHKKSCVIM